MTRPVFIVPVGYGRPCRLLTIGTTRHVTACRASIPADEPVIITTQRPAELCAACEADLTVREARGDDLTPYAGELGVRAEVEPTVRAAEELFGPMPKLSAAVEVWDSWHGDPPRDPDDDCAFDHLDDLQPEVE